MRDYDRDLREFQAKLDANGIDFDVTNLAGATYKQINGYVNALIKRKQAQVNANVTN